MKARRRRNGGSVLVEGLLTVAVLTAAVIGNVEIVRRATFALLMQHGAFLSVRDRALGAGSGSSRERVRQFLHDALSPRLAAQVSRRLRMEHVVDGQGLQGRLHYEYGGLLTVPFNSRSHRKRKFEVTEKCRFPW